MTLLALCGGLLLAVALMVREVQLRRERAAARADHDRLFASVETAVRHLRRTREDLYVMRTVMQERGVLTEEDLARGRARLIETPRRRAEERDQMLKELKIADVPVILDEGESVH